MKPFLLLLILVSISQLSVSCISKKKFLASKMECDSLSTLLNNRIVTQDREIKNMQLRLAEKTGENTGLLTIYDKQEAKIEQLQNQIDKITNQALSRQQLMDLALQRKDEEIAEKQQIAEKLQTAIDKQKKNSQEILTKTQEALRGFDQKELSFENKEGRAHIGLSEKLLFRSGTASMTKEAAGILGKIAEVLNNRPEIAITVVGHTDNVPARSREFQDNWDLSAVRAAAVVRVLTKDFYLTPSQVTVAGKGEFEPKASNETTEGKALNRRIEIVVAPRLDEVMRILQQH
jgi:chemotaxis protein MotB